MSNRTRQNKKRAGKKMESNDSPEIPDRRETTEEPGFPSGQKQGGVYGRYFEIIKYRLNDRNVRNQKNDKK